MILVILKADIKLELLNTIESIYIFDKISEVTFDILKSVEFCKLI